MISKNEFGFYLEYDATKYYFTGEKYEQFILFLTDPNINLYNEIKIDDSITEEEDKYISSVYKDFLNKFIASRKQIDKEIEEDKSVSENIFFED